MSKKKFKNESGYLEIDYSKVESIEDIKSILKCFDLNVSIWKNEIPKHCDQAYNRGLLKEKL